MKHIVLFYFLFLLAACTDPGEEKVQTDSDLLSTPTGTGVTTNTSHTYYGSYVGSFDADQDKVKDGLNATYSNKINIQVHQLQDGKVTGRSIIAGNDRPFRVSYTQESSTFKIIASEPGDDPHDGRFEFTLDTSSHTLNGTWYCNDTNIAVPVRVFKLEKKEFVYDPNRQVDSSIIGASMYNGPSTEEYESSYEAVTKSVLKYNASNTKLEKKDVANLYKGDLEVIRNAIYARHGYSFRNRRMRYLFDNYVEWYMPVSVDVRSELTALEKENIELLKRYEDHAAKYYDEFSR